MARWGIVLSFAAAWIVLTSPVPAQQIDTQQLNIIKDTAASICNTVVTAKGQKTDLQIQGEVNAQLNGLLGKLVNVGGSSKTSLNREEFEGLSREATAAALEGDRGCRERVFDKMFDKLSNTSPATPKEIYMSGRKRSDARTISWFLQTVGPVVTYNIINEMFQKSVDYYEVYVDDNTMRVTEVLTFYPKIITGNSEETTGVCSARLQDLDEAIDVPKHCPPGFVEDIVSVNCLSGDCFSCKYETKLQSGKREGPTYKTQTRSRLV